MLEILYHRTISGFKTQTRRAGASLDVVNGNKKKGIDTNPDDWELVRVAHISGIKSFTIAKFWQKGNALNEVYCRARYHIDEILFIKEPLALPTTDKFRYLYDIHPDNRENLKLHGGLRVSNKMFSPLKSARKFIQITGITVERLHDISPEDCADEGIEYDMLTGWLNYDPKNKRVIAFGSPKLSFFSLYRLANKYTKPGFPPNIWVFVYHYKHLKDYKHEAIA